MSEKTAKMNLTFVTKVQDDNFKKTMKELQTSSGHLAKNVANTLGMLGKIDASKLEKSLGKVSKTVDDITDGFRSIETAIDGIDIDDMVQDLTDVTKQNTKIEKGFKASKDELEEMTRYSDFFSETLEDGSKNMKVVNYYVDEFGNLFANSGRYVSDVEKELDKMPESMRKAVMEAKGISDEMQKAEREAEGLDSAISNAASEASGLEKRAGGVESELGQAKNEAEGLDSALGQADNEMKSMENRSKNIAKGLKDAGDGLNKAGDILTAGVTVPALALGAASVAGQDELRQTLGMLDAKQSNDDKDISMDSINEAMRIFASIGADEDASGEAISLMMEFSENSEQFLQVAKMIAGAFVRFPDATTVESIAESMNETLKTGKVTGQYADLLDWTGSTLDTATIQELLDGFSSVEVELPPVDIQLIDVDAIKAQRYSEDSSIQSRRSEEDRALAGKRAAEDLKLSKEQLKAIKENRKQQDAAIKAQRKAEDDALKDRRRAEDATVKAENEILKEQIKTAEKQREDEMKRLTEERGKESYKENQGNARDTILKGLGNGEADFSGEYDNYANINKDLVDSKQATYDLNVALKDLGDTLLPIITELTKLATEYLTIFNGLDAETKDTIIKVVGALAVFGPVLKFFGSILGTISSISSAFGTMKIAATLSGGAATAAGASTATAGAVATAGLLPIIGTILLIIGAIALLVYAIYSIVKHWDYVKEQSMKIWDTMVGGFTMFMDNLRNIFSLFKTGVEGDGSSLGNNFISNFIQGIMNGINILKSTLGQIRSMLWEGIGNVFFGGLGKLDGNYSADVNQKVNHQISTARNDSTIPTQKQPAQINLNVGKRGFNAFVEDIGDSLNRKTNHEMAYR